MVEPVKSILLVDLDGLGRGLAASAGEDVAERLAERIADWSGAIESGELIEPAGTQRTIVTRRCYVTAASPEGAREAFAGAGFELVDCDGQSQVELCLAIDAIDAAADAEDDLDVILLTAAPDLAPLVERLQARGHHVAAYVGAATAEAYRAAADMTIAESRLGALLSQSKEPPKAAAAATSLDRNTIEAFAREIHGATSIPMFSPKTFADLFRFLASEVRHHGYHFNDTAKNVAKHLTDSGRNVTSRQVVFVVKGLALKGHVFSNSDTAERLAEVFREQARYLISGAGIALDDEREALLEAWIAAPAPALPARPARPEQPAAAAKPARPAQPADDDGEPPRKPAPARRPDRPTAAKPAPATTKPAPTAAKPATPPRVPERPKSAVLQAKAEEERPEPKKPSKASADLRATIAARIAASAKMKPSSRPAPKSDQSEAPPPPPPRKPVAPPEDADEAIESSILAAIAEAVDVLVEDGSSKAAKARSAPPDREPREPPQRRAAADHPPPEEPPQPEEPAEEEEESGDIGDEIQRIVASYNRNREEDGRG